MLDLYLLSETIIKGLNHCLLSFVSIGSAINGIFLIVSKNPLVSVLFLIGLFFIIHLAMPGNTVNFNHEQIQEVKPVEDQNDDNSGSTFNLVHSNTTNSRGGITPNSQFVWDKNNPNNTRLGDLFFPNRLTTYNGKVGVIITHSGHGWDPHQRVAMVSIPHSRLLGYTNNGTTILTNGSIPNYSPAPYGMIRVHIEENR